MPPPTEFLFCDSQLGAFLTAIVESFARRIGSDHALSAAHLQRIAYACQSQGVPLHARFLLHTRGFYSDEIEFLIDSLAADGVIADGATADTGIRPGARLVSLLERYAKTVDGYRAKIDQVVDALGVLRKQELELVSALHFEYERTRQFHPGTLPHREQVIAEVKQVKRDRFSDDDLGRVYESLQLAGLLA